MARWLELETGEGDPVDQIIVYPLISLDLRNASRNPESFGQRLTLCYPRKQLRTAITLNSMLPGHTSSGSEVAEALYTSSSTLEPVWGHLIVVVSYQIQILT